MTKRYRPKVSPPFSEQKKLRRPLSEAEKSVLNLFYSQLGSGWEIYVRPHLNGLRPDFALLSPDSGIAIFDVLEMKRLDHRDPVLPGIIRRSIWMKKEIHQLYCPRLDRRAGFGLITSGLNFSEIFSENVEPNFYELLQAFNIFGCAQNPTSFKDSLDARALSQIFPLHNRRIGNFFSDEMAQDFRCWLEEPDQEAVARDPLPLNKRQRELVNTRTSGGYRRIKGPAGTGKSLILAARAATVAAEGKRVLVVTYNITLVHYLRSLAERHDYRSVNRITWIHFHRWCKRIAELSAFGEDYLDIWRRQKQGEDSLHQVLHTDVPTLIEKAYSSCPTLPKYDAILVDEGQDFSPGWWPALRAACKPGGEMLLVADSTQDLYGTARSWTDKAMLGAGFPGNWIQLDECFRLPQGLYAFQDLRPARPARR